MTTSTILFILFYLGMIALTVRIIVFLDKHRSGRSIVRDRHFQVMPLFVFVLAVFWPISLALIIAYQLVKFILRFFGIILDFVADLFD